MNDSHLLALAELRDYVEITFHEPTTLPALDAAIAALAAEQERDRASLDEYLLTLDGTHKREWWATDRSLHEEILVDFFDWVDARAQRAEGEKS